MRCVWPRTITLFLCDKASFEHCAKWATKNLDETERGLNMDDILSGGLTVEEIKELKSTTTDILETAPLKLHKWNSNDHPVGGIDPRRRNKP